MIHEVDHMLPFHLHGVQQDVSLHKLVRFHTLVLQNHTTVLRVKLETVLERTVAIAVNQLWQVKTESFTKTILRILHSKNVDNIDVAGHEELILEKLYTRQLLFLAALYQLGENAELNRGSDLALSL